MTQHTSLPEPDEAGRAHSRELVRLMQQRSAGSAFSFHDFMHSALFEPGFGYYMAGAQKFGELGDFVTAPEITPLFGRCVARQVLEVLDICGGDILEFGAGAGGLAASIVPLLADKPDTRYWILEPSADLQQRQRQRLKKALSSEQFSCVDWLGELPQSFTGVYLANEVLDAFAVECFRINESRQVEQLQVSVTGDSIDEHWEAAPQPLENHVRYLEEDIGRTLPEGYRSEANLSLQPWLDSIAAVMQTGAVVLIDYGYPRREYYSEERSNGTLTSYFRHHAHNDPYRFPGLQDLTAHVDFTSVVEAGDKAGMSLLGYTTQASFLMALGLLQLADSEAGVCASEIERISMLSAVKTLTLPEHMGERFQVMALGKGLDKDLQGFRLLDLSHRL